MTEKEFEERNCEIAAMRRAGATYQQIGEKYGMTRQGAHEIMRRYCPELVNRDVTRKYGRQ